jgi:glycosyltransferase involved in cell wall biosynthesis
VRESRARVLTVVIPALDEELAIESTIRRCLDVREEIKHTAGVEDIEIIVVSDGSRDRTTQIARGFDEVSVIEFEQNRGYGAAIKEGVRQGTGDLVGFLDADGTCDPHYFCDMCRLVLEDGADMVLGSRMGADSRMPPIRKLGNRMFAFLLGLLCGRWVTDTASGMRVIRRTALELLYPLPDRLHFTPSMSAKALTSGLRVVEIPMRYEERIGASKLRLLSDGIQFLRTIIDAVLCFRPERMFFMIFTLFLIISLLLAMYPVEYYWHNRRIEEWMIYRFIACFLLGSMGYVLLTAAVLANRMAALGARRREADSFWIGIVANLFRGLPLAVFAASTLGASIALIWPGIAEFFRTGQITLHWSRIIVGAFGLLLVFQTLITAVMLRIVGIWKYQRDQSASRNHDRTFGSSPLAGDYSDYSSRF